MPTLNDTRVRVDGLSKITATARGPASGVNADRSLLDPVGQVEHLELLGRAEVVVAEEVRGRHQRTPCPGPVRRRRRTRRRRWRPRR